jgi:EF hand
MTTISKYAMSTAVLLTLGAGLAFAQQANAPVPADQQTAAACDDRNDGDADCMGGQGGRHHGKGRGGHGEGRGGHHGRGMMIIDTNNDGFINADEAAALADAAFMHIDQNRDSVIDQTEAASLPDRKGWRAWFGNTPSAEVTAKLKAAFAERDTDKDGKVTKLEFMTFAQNKYASLDTAKDGKVSPWAFRAMPRL